MIISYIFKVRKFKLNLVLKETMILHSYSNGFKCTYLQINVLDLKIVMEKENNF